MPSSTGNLSHTFNNVKQPLCSCSVRFYYSSFSRQSQAIQFDLEQIAKNAVRYNEPDSLIVRQAQLITSLALKSLSDPAYNVVCKLYYFFCDSSNIIVLNSI